MDQQQKSRYEVGDQIKTWFSNREDGISTVLEIKPYNGPYKFIKCILVLTAPRTKAGKIEMTSEE